MKTENELNIEEPVAGVYAPGDELARPCGADCGLGVASGCMNPEKPSASLTSVPADLQVFVRSLPVRDVARQLGLATGTVGRLRKGYWPADPSKILKAWAAYRGRGGATSKRWVLRCVYAGGLLRQGKYVYTAQQLGARVGELLAVARSVDGALIAQPLQPPMERFALQRVET